MTYTRTGLDSYDHFIQAGNIAYLQSTCNDLLPQAAICQEDPKRAETQDPVLATFHPERLCNFDLQCCNAATSLFMPCH